MLNWLLYTGLVGGLLTLAAHCVGRVCHLMARPTRWGWVSALTLTGALTGVAPYRAGILSRLQSTPWAAPSTGSAVRQPATRSTGRVSKSLQFFRREIATPIRETVSIPVQRVPAALDAYVAVAWGTLSAVVLLVFCTVYVRFRRVRRGWPISELHGVRVRIAPDGGPVVIGIVHPEIIIPQWLLGRTAEEQRVVLTHEQEHIRAGDPWLLAGACAIAALFPWHPFVWWMASRLRLAIELDCDTRVLRRGVAPRAYGSLLIDLAERYSGLSVGAPALADNRSHLKRRLLAMQAFRPRFAAPQGFVFGISALCFLVTACIAQVPTRVDRHRDRTTWNHTDKEIVRLHRRECNPDSVYEGAKTPEDSAHRFFGVMGNPGITMTPVPSSITWSSLFDENEVPDSVCARLFGNEAARNAAELNAVHDSVLVLVDGVRRGVFPINERIPFSQLHLSRAGVHGFGLHFGGHWAVVLYGPQAANGVVDVQTRESDARHWAAWLHRLDSVHVFWEAQVEGDFSPPATILQILNSYKNRLSDSVLILVDSTRRGVFPVREPIPFSQLNLHPPDIKYLNVATGPPAIRRYGPNIHGVINIITKTQEDRGSPPSRSVREDPMVIVDGVQLTPDSGRPYRSAIDKIDPNDVATIYVFKGLEAVKRYGDKAKNGVIIVATKSSQASKSKYGGEPDSSFH